MTLRVSGKNMDVGEALRSKAEGQFDGVIKKYFDGGYTGHLTLEHEGSGLSRRLLGASRFGRGAAGEHLWRRCDLGLFAAH